MSGSKLDIVFDGVPGDSGPRGPRFIEVELDHRGIRAGKWVTRKKGMPCALRLDPVYAEGPRLLKELKSMVRGGRPGPPTIEQFRAALEAIARAEGDTE